MPMLHVSRRLDDRPLSIYSAKKRNKLSCGYTESPYASLYVIVINARCPFNLTTQKRQMSQTSS